MHIWYTNFIYFTSPKPPETGAENSSLPQGQPWAVQPPGKFISTHEKKFLDAPLLDVTLECCSLMSLMESLSWKGNYNINMSPEPHDAWKVQLMPVSTDSTSICCRCNASCWTRKWMTWRHLPSQDGTAQSEDTPQLSPHLAQPWSDVPKQGGIGWRKGAHALWLQQTGCVWKKRNMENYRQGKYVLSALYLLGHHRALH